MTAQDRFGCVDALFRAAVALPPAERGAYLSRQCGGDVSLQAQVMELLAADQRPGPLDLPPLVRASDALGANSAAAGAAVPEHIGRYRILRKIGEGGMGAVYEAQQESPRRLVALKTLRRDLCSDTMLRRFEFEASVLGQLQHEGIASIFESGWADVFGARVPYFAMELVHGEPLTQHADRMALGPRQRLALIASIAAAVQHAHAKGVVHRDLKPANILVEDNGRPRILDFGVARIISPDSQVASIQTTAGQLVGTLAYMSPEQVSGDPAAVDTRSDIYSLGVILFELLAGQLPCDVSSRSIGDAILRVRDEQPLDLGTINSAYRGDIATIAAKALEKDKERRYQTAADLAADIGRYLRDEPIVARRPTTRYLLRKFAKRNRVLVGGVSVALLLLLGGITTTTIQAMRARQAEAQAREQGQRAEGMNRFLAEDMIGAALRGPDRLNAKLVDVVLASIPKIDSRFANDAHARAIAKRTAGDMLLALGRWDEARELVRESLKLLRETRGELDRDALIAEWRLGEIEVAAGNPAEGERIYRAAYERARRIDGADGRLTMGLLSELGEALQAQGKFAEAEPLLTRIASAYRGKLDDDDMHLLGFTLSSLSGCLYAQKKYNEAVPVAKECLALCRRRNGLADEGTLSAMNTLANLYLNLKQPEQARALLAESLELAAKIWPAGNSRLGLLKLSYAACLHRLGQDAEAEPVALAAYSILENSMGQKRFETERANLLLIDIYRELRLPDKLEAVLARAVELRRLIEDNPEHASVLDKKREYGTLLLERGKAVEALQVIDPALDIARQRLPESDEVRRQLESASAAAHGALTQ